MSLPRVGRLSGRPWVDRSAREHPLVGLADGGRRGVIDGPGAARFAEASLPFGVAREFAQGSDQGLGVIGGDADTACGCLLYTSDAADE